MFATDTKKRRRRPTQWISTTCCKRRCRCFSSTSGSRNFIGGSSSSFSSMNTRTRTKFRLTWWTFSPAITANVQQFRKHLSATRESKALKPALVALNDGAEQAQFVTQRILELRDENVDLNDIAVLYRAHYHAVELQLELSRRGIPYQITSGIRFFEQAHIKDVTSFIRFVANPRDEVAFNRMVKLLPGIGNRTAENLWRAWA